MKKEINRKELTKRREEATLSTLKQVDKTIWMMEFKGDYALDQTLAQGIKSMTGMCRLLMREINSPPMLFNPMTGDFGCSTFNTRNPQGDCIMGRNFDYKDSLCIVVWTNPYKGYRSMTITLGAFMAYGKKWKNLDSIDTPRRLMGAPYACMDGINEKGLCAAILEIKTKPTKQDTGKTPITTSVALRAILDKCATVDEAVELLSNYDMHDMIFANYHYQISDAQGGSVIIEYVNNEMKVIRQKEKDESLVLTNYFLSEGGDNSKEMGRDRYKRIEDHLCDCGGTMTEEEAMKLLSECTLNYRHKWLRHMVITVWSAVYNCQKKTLTLSADMDYSKAYRFSLDEPGKVIKL